MLWFNVALDVTAITTSVIASIYSIGTGGSNAVLRMRGRRLQRRLDAIDKQLTEAGVETIGELVDEIAKLKRASARRVPQPPPPAPGVPPTNAPTNGYDVPFRSVVERAAPSTRTPATHQARHGAAAQVPVSAVPPVIGEALEELTRAADTTGIIPAILGGEMPDERAGLYNVHTGQRIGWGDVA